MAHFRNGLEHRWGERIRVNIPVRVSTAALVRVDGCVKNLSLSGAFMACDYELRLHALIEVHIELPSTVGRTGVVEAYVSRKLDEGIGIEWCEFAPRIVKDLLRGPWARVPHRPMSVAEQTGDGTGAMIANPVSSESRI
jgi:PilZ domain